MGAVELLMLSYGGSISTVLTWVHLGSDCRKPSALGSSDSYSMFGLVILGHSIYSVINLPLMQPFAHLAM